MSWISADRAVDVLGRFRMEADDATRRPCAKSGTMRSTGFTIRCTSIGTLAVRPDRLRTPAGPIVRFGT
mgnify:CR=1 FL=1